MGGAELMGEIDFGFGLRAEVVEIIAELGLVFVGGFIEEDDGADGESVGEGVEGGWFAGRSGSGSGLGGVGASGFDFAARGRHGVFSPSIRAQTPACGCRTSLSVWVETRRTMGEAGERGPAQAKPSFLA